jgi:PAS domain S-box-containing protein
VTSAQVGELVWASAPDGLLVADATATIVAVNEQLLAMTGCREDELVGQHIGVLMPADVRAEHGVRFAAYLEAPRVAPMGDGATLRLRRRDGTTVPADLTAAPGTLDGAPVTLVWVRDATVRQELLERERLATAVLDERQRISRDLHDMVIQDVVAVGLQLSAGLSGETDPGHRDRDSALVDQLERVVDRLRDAVGHLKAPRTGSPFRESVREVVTDAQRTLGFVPSLRLVGPIDDLDHELQGHVLAVLLESLSNAVRHAHAAAVDVSVSSTADEVRVVVTDDGVGLPEPVVRGEGLDNLQERARACGGAVRLGPRSGTTGTRVDWRVPRRVPPDLGDAP